MLRFQLLVGEGRVPLRAAARRWAASRRCCCPGETGVRGWPASGNACSREGRASAPCATARGQDIVEVKDPRAAACFTEPFSRSSPLELLGMLGPACRQQGPDCVITYVS